MGLQWSCSKAVSDVTTSPSQWFFLIWEQGSVSISYYTDIHDGWNVAASVVLPS